MNDIILFGYGKNGKSIAQHLGKKNILIVVFYENEKEEVLHDGYLNVEFLDEKILDEDLIKIGIKKAKVAIAVLEDEARNMFLTLSIRNLNQFVKIIAKVENKESVHRYKLAGVTEIINPYEITANRIDSLIKKPITLEFIHNIVFEHSDLVFAQIEILEDSVLDGKKLSELEEENFFENIIPIGIIDREKSDNVELIVEDRKLDSNLVRKRLKSLKWSSKKRGLNFQNYLYHYFYFSSCFNDILVVIGDIEEINNLKKVLKEQYEHSSYWSR